MKESFVEFIENKLGSNFLLITCGLPATGKSTAAKRIAEVTGYPWLRSDMIRLDVLKGEDVFDGRVASDMGKRTQVYDEMFRQTEENLSKNRGAILDATFVTQDLRLRAAEIADRHDLTLVILETDCPQEVAIGRLARRTGENYQSNALTEEAYLNNKRRFEKVDVDDLKKHHPDISIVYVLVDTTADRMEGWYINKMEKR